MGEGEELRAEMVEAARKFMSTPKVRDTPFAEQRQFLLGKGVTEAEIEEARRSLPAAGASSMDAHVYAAPPRPSGGERAMNLAQSALVLGGITYAGYRFFRGYVFPKFFDVPDPAQEEKRMLEQQINELQNSMKFVMDSIQQLSQQQEHLSRTLLASSGRGDDMAQLVSGINTIKALLLSQTQFAPIQTPAANHLPAWQRGSQAQQPAQVPAWQKAKEMENHVEKRKIEEARSEDGFQTPPPGDVVEDEEEDEELHLTNGITA